MPGEQEQQQETELRSGEQQLDVEKIDHQTVEERPPCQHERDHSSTRERLEAGQHQIEVIGIAPVIMGREPAAGDQMPVGTRHDEQMEQAEHHDLPGEKMAACRNVDGSNAGMGNRENR